MADEDVLDVGNRAGDCPECGGKLRTEIDDVAVYDSKGRITRLEIEPDWCPQCGWEPT